MIAKSVPSFYISLELLLSEERMSSSEKLVPGKGTADDEVLLLDEKEDGRYMGKPVQAVYKPGELPPPNPMRWLVLLVFCSCSFMQVVIWNTWSPIARSALFAFPSWNQGSVALFNNWGCLCFVFLIGPVCWMLNEKGLRFSCLLAGGLSLIGCGLRCITMQENIFTWLAHVGGILNAIAGVVFGPAVVLMSSTWFPAHQRTSATGVGTATSFLGMAVSYLVGPFIVSENIPQTRDKVEIGKKRANMKDEIQSFMYIEFGIECVLFIILLTWFPKSPPSPPSHSSCVSIVYKKDFKKAVYKLLRNGNAWLLALSAALASGMTGPWLSQLVIIFSNRNLSQNEVARLGFWTIITCCALGGSVSRVSDMFQGHLKMFLLCLMSFACLMFAWIFYCTTIAEDFNKYILMRVVMAGFSASWSTSALFYELGAEIAYPIPEGIVAGFIMTLCSLSCVIVYAYLYFSSPSDLKWLNFGLVLYNIGAIIILCLVDEQYNRLKLDEPGV